MALRSARSALLGAQLHLGLVAAEREIRRALRGRTVRAAAEALDVPWGVLYAWLRRYPSLGGIPSAEAYSGPAVDGRKVTVQKVHTTQERA